MRVGADVYNLYSAVDAISHEYDLDEGEYVASGHSQLEWFLFQVGRRCFNSNRWPCTLALAITAPQDVTPVTDGMGSLVSNYTVSPFCRAVPTTG